MSVKKYIISINYSKLYIYSLCRTARRQGMGLGIPTSWARAQMPSPSAKLRERSLASKITQLQGLQIGVPNGKKNKHYPKMVIFFWGGENYVQSSKLFMVELEMSRLWQHFAASVMNSVSGVPSPLGHDPPSSRHGHRAQGFLQRLPFYERRREPMGFQDCSIHVIHQRNLTIA